MMPLLRIGKYTKGEVRKATLQINDNQPPPSFSHKQRTAHRKLINDTRDIVTKYLFHDRIDDVMKWIEMTDIYNPIKDNDVTATTTTTIATTKVVVAVRWMWVTITVI